MKQIIVKIERVDQPAAAPDLQPTHSAIFGRTAGRIERRQRSSSTRDSIAPGLRDVAEDIHLIGVQSRDIEREMRGRSGAPLQSRINVAELRVELVLELPEG